MPACEQAVGEALAYGADHLVAPEGYGVEIVDGWIVVTCTPDGRHAVATHAVRSALRPLLPSGSLAVERITLELPGSERYVPDLVVMPRAVLDSSESMFPAQEALLVAEVTSPGNGEIDRVAKLRGYASSGVPLYLLVDRQDRTVSLFSDPVGRIYRHHLQVPFGDAIPLPPPFTSAIETVDFV